MKNRERYLYLCTIIIITIISFVGRSNIKREIELLEEYNGAEIKGFEETTNTTYLSEDFELNPAGLIYSNDIDTICLSAITNNPKLILYHGDNSCGVCLDSLLSNIASCFGSDTRKFAVLSKPESYRDIFVQITNNGFSYDVFSVINDLGIPLCARNIPFLFLLDDDFCAKCLFIPNREEPERTKLFLNIINKRFINQKVEIL